ncbi:MAG: hypothetical protein NZ989_08000, partial [Bacteroidia bacterium]|nr:hypothetical protein [Bacteroidia bacterium]
MWGADALWIELLLIGAGIFNRWRSVPPAFLLLYGVALHAYREKETALLAFSSAAVEIGSLFSLLTALLWGIYPLRGAASWALLLQLGSYTLLLRSRNLAFTWSLMESAAISGYFFVANAGAAPQKWNAALRYFTWSVVGSALILLSLSLRLSEGLSITYPLSGGKRLADTLLSLGWAVKVGLIPWHFWLMGIYRSLAAAWGGWFFVVPKGALLLNLLSALSPQGLNLYAFYMLGAISLVSAYALAWQAQNPVEMIFWGSFAQGAYAVLAATTEGIQAAQDFWLVYSIAGILGLLYVEKPWRGRWGWSVGVLLLANLAALPPVLGFWVKLQLFWVGIAYLPKEVSLPLVGAAIIATLGGFAVYGKILWRLWSEKEASPLPAWRKVLYVIGAGGLFGLGLGGIGKWMKGIF